MVTAQYLPEPFQELLDLVERGELGSALSQLRRQVGCTSMQARQFLDALPTGLDCVSKFPDIAAALLGDPQPSLLRQFHHSRPLLLREIRRRRRLNVLRILTEDGQVSASDARRFMQALEVQGHNWLELEQVYGRVPDDFWQVRPQPEPFEAQSMALVLQPEEFDPELLLSWLRQGLYRDGVLWVRRLTGAARETCQQLIDRLEELAFDEHPDPWSVVTGEYPEMVAGLAGLPNPNWLRKLAPKKGQLLEWVGSQRSQAATELVVAELGCSNQEARRFLRSLHEPDIWERALKRFDSGKVFEAPPPAPEPEPVVEAVAAPVVVAAAPVALAAPVLLQGPAGDDKVLEELLAPLEEEPEEVVEPVAKARRAMPWDLPATPTPAVVVKAEPKPKPQPLSLNDTDEVFERLLRFREALAKDDMVAAQDILLELELAGFNRNWVAQRHPVLVPWLPDEPWSEQLPEVAEFAENLEKVMRGEVSPADLAAQALHKANLEEIVGALESAWKTKKKEDFVAAAALLNEHPQLAQEVNERLPWLADMMDLDQDGTADIIEAASDPGQYFTELLNNKFPDLRQRLGEARIARIKEVLPDLLEATRQRNMRGVMSVMSRLKLGPSDIKALLGVLKAMLKRK